MSLSIATKANQSSTIPALLAAALVNETPGAGAITVNFKDVEALKKDDKTAATELVLGAGPPVYGDLQVVKKIAEAHPDALVGTQQKLVGVHSFGPYFPSGLLSQGSADTTDRRKNGSNAPKHCHLRTSSPLRACCRSWILI
jgi:hypothetical protein